MKPNNIFLFLIFLLLIGCSREEHIEFNNIPIDGNLIDFGDELIKLGFTNKKQTEENQIMLRGVFLERDCEVYVSGTRKSQKAYKVIVNLPGEVRDSLEYSFDKMQKLFTAKYGRGTSKYQQYRNSERFLFNEPKRTRRLSKGDFTRFTLKSGIIIMEVRDGYISITYSDKLNTEISKLEMEL